MKPANLLVTWHDAEGHAWRIMRNDAAAARFLRSLRAKGFEYEVAPA